MATLAPPSASRTAAARPMPRDPPVTSATLFSKSMPSFYPFSQLSRVSPFGWRSFGCLRDRHLVAACAMRIGLIGLGAIGGVTAQRLLAAGCDLTLAAGRHLAVMRQKFPEARIGETRPEGPYGLILLCVRTADTERALTPAAPLLAPDGAVVCLQNGLPEERAARMVGAGRVLGAVIGWSATMTSPGEYLITGK